MSILIVTYPKEHRGSVIWIGDYENYNLTRSVVASWCPAAFFTLRCSYAVTTDGNQQASRSFPDSELALVQLARTICCWRSGIWHCVFRSVFLHSSALHHSTMLGSLTHILARLDQPCSWQPMNG